MRRTRTSLAGLTAAALVAVAAPAATQAAPTSYPGGGSGFAAGTEGWTGSAASCAPLAGLDITCTATTEHSSTVGRPPGSINSRLDVLVNLAGLLRGQTTWTSPDFTVPAGTPVAGAAVALDRRIDGGGLALDPQSTYVVSLVDRSAGNRTTPVLTESIDQTDTAFARTAGSIPEGAVVAGRTYAISIQTTTATRVARVGLLGALNTRYDNVSLTVSDTRAGANQEPIGDGATGSPGVTVTQPPLSDRAMRAFLGTFNAYAEVGKGPGGSLVPSSRCTIVGTPGKDRIKGTKGNDVICGLGGDDTINGAGGNDVIDTGDDNDRASGATGKDTLVGVRGKDRLNGNSSADRLGGGAAGDRLTGSTGNDSANGGSGNDRLTGSSGNDRLAGAAGKDRLAGVAGKDRVDGGKGNDRLNGGKGSDRIIGGAGRDTIAARDRSRDRVDGGTGRDSARVDRRARASARGRSRADRVRRVERIR